MGRHILDLPAEILENIFSYLEATFETRLCLSQVCSVFRNVSCRMPIALTLPIKEELLDTMSELKIPIYDLTNNEPALFINHQLSYLNIERLHKAEFLGPNFRASNQQLLPEYYQSLHFLSYKCGKTLRKLLIHGDLSKIGFGRELQFIVILSSFKNLTSLNLLFNNQIALQQKISKGLEAQTLIYTAVKNLEQLRFLSMHHCPTDQLIIHSNSLEELHITRSPFMAFKELKTPKLINLIISECEFLAQIFFIHKQNFLDDSVNPFDAFFQVLYRGCPKLENFNDAKLKRIQGLNLSENRWCQFAFELYIRTFREDFNPNDDDDD